MGVDSVGLSTPDNNVGLDFELKWKSELSYQ
jgi:hypothetical protein